MLHPVILGISTSETTVNPAPTVVTETVVYPDYSLFSQLVTVTTTVTIATTITTSPELSFNCSDQQQSSSSTSSSDSDDVVTICCVPVVIVVEIITVIVLVIVGEWCGGKGRSRAYYTLTKNLLTML